MSKRLDPTGLRGVLAGLGTACVVLLALTFLPADAAAQQMDGFPVVTPNHVLADPNSLDGALSLTEAEIRARSRFNLYANVDQAYTGMRMVGTMSYFMSNAGPGDWNYDPGYLGYLLHRGAWRHNFFEITLMAGAARSTFVRNKDRIPGLQNIRNEDGYVGFMNGFMLGNVVNFNAADLTLGELFSGVTSTDDGTCRDHTGGRSGFLEVGVPLLAGSNCPETWGRASWLGSPPITGDAWEEFFLEQGNDFRFKWWDVPEDLHGPGFIGNFQTFGTVTDFYRERLVDYGAVIPGGAGAPVKDGYPLGLEFEFDAFSFTLPTVANAVFWQAKVTNRSDEIYPGGIDYDSLYLGFSPQPSNTRQETSTYYEPHKGSIRWVNNGVNPACNNATTPPGVAGCITDAQRGFYWGASQMIVLNSPIGDLRNKLFSNDASPFYSPGHPAAGDTITFNHGHPCGYGGCAMTTILTGSARRAFGMLSSTDVNVLDGRDVDGLTNAEYWRTFYSRGYPDRTGGFNRYVPGDWTYSNRPPGAPIGPDTLTLATCYGEGSPADACVVTWSDTMPGGQNNRYANVQVFSIGPFPLKVGESVPLTVAIMVSPDSVTAEEIQAAVIDLYTNFWLSPQSPRPPTLVATSVKAGDIRDAEVTLYLGDDTELWEDAFLLDFQSKLLAAPAGTGLYTMRALNPWLADSVQARARRNTAELHIYKSCNGGTTWTSTASCVGNPTTGLDGAPVGNGWEPAAILRPDAQGRFVNSWTDRGVRPGIEYTYAVVAKSRGAKWSILDETPTSEVFAREFEIAPELLAPLSAGVTEPNVARVYIPVSLQAGSTLAAVDLPPEEQRGAARVPFNNLSVTLAGEPEAGASYRIIFGDRFVITEGPDTTSVEVMRDTLQEFYSVAIPRTVTINFDAGQRSVVVDGETTITTIENALGILIVRRSDGAPLLVSTDLRAAGTTTPGAFITREDFPNIVVNVDNTKVGNFHGAFYFNEAGDSLLARAAPRLLWADRDAVRVDPAGVGEYEFLWQDRSYGPGSPIEIVFGSAAETGDALRATLQARQVAQQTIIPADEVFDAVLDVIVAEFTAAGFDPSARLAAEVLTSDDFIAARLPFQVRNITYDRPVTAVMLRREVRARLVALADGLDVEGVATRERAAHQITLGSGTDVQPGVPVPEDIWIPGDRLYLLEEVDGESVVTWRNTSLACISPRAACNPVRGRGASVYVEPRAGYSHRVRYYVPFSVASEFTVNVAPAVTGADVVVTREALDQILVVPNPYLAYSIYEQGGSRDAVLYFINMPPEGTLRIYTVAGHFVQEINWTPEDLTSLDATVQSRSRSSGDLRWNLRSREGNDIAAGLYVFVVEAGGHRMIGKFVVIR